MSDVLDLVKADLIATERAREENRKAMPGVAAIKDKFDELFGPTKILWAKEGDREVGKQRWIES